jgi:hypothetical protein
MSYPGYPDPLTIRVRQSPGIGEFDLSALGVNTVVALGFKRTAGTMGSALRVVGVEATVVDWMN